MTKYKPNLASGISRIINLNLLLTNYVSILVAKSPEKGGGGLNLSYIYFYKKYV